MDKDNTVYVHDGTSGNLKNERKPVTCYNTVYNVKDIILSQKTNIVLFHSFEIPKVVKITDTGKKKGGYHGRRGKSKSLVGTAFRCCKMRKFQRSVAQQCYKRLR